MNRTTGSLGRPIQGISQQPEEVRLLGQCEDSVNFRPDVVDGAITRPGTMYGAKIRDISIPENAKTYEYERGTGESYYIVIEDDGTVTANSEDGTEHIVNVTADALSYLISGGDPKTNLRLKTISDYTFIINKTERVSESSTLNPVNDQTAIAYVQFMDYQQTQEIYIQHPGASVYSEVASYTSPDGTDSQHLAEVGTSFVASALYDDLELSIGSSGTNDYTISIDGNCVYITRDDGQEFAIKTIDDADNGNLVALKDRIEDTTKLSPKAPDGFVIEIDPPGSNTLGNSNYWLEAVNTNGQVSWREAAAPGISVGFDKATMPITMVRSSIDSGIATFDITLGEWGDRDVGDARTNPFPSFLGSRINSIGITQNRLEFTSGENLVTSRTGEFFEFFRATAQVTLDTSPIDIYADSDQINILEASVPFDGDVVFFSQNGQFTILGDKVITPDNANLRQTTSFKSDLSVDPVASGENIFFCFKSGQYLGIREYFTDSVTDTKRARPITEHVDKMMKGDPIAMKASTNINLLLVQTDHDTSILYCYDWLWKGADKVQAAWTKLEFNGDVIRDFYFRESDVVLVIERSDGTYIERMNINAALEGNIPFQICLDRKQEVTISWNDTLERWETPDIFPDEDADDIVMVMDLDSDQAGIPISFLRSGSTLYSYDWIGDTALSTSESGIIGLLFDCLYTPTNPVPKDANGTPMDLDKFTIARMFINYITTGDVSYTTVNRFGDSKTVTRGNRIVGFPNNLVGYDPLIKGTHRVGIKKRARRFTFMITTRDYRPFNLREIQWSGSFKPRGRRLQT